ncbi:hypothetical protein [Streptantibioticus silvisoli]|uniref:Uncharacterized protein n=1 Tax=Streptantibioticus silvisoli TaxID=2705255 RepID=A0ABT6VXT7_9ACTN|nr:hypothetical protein [Streptantibioticus silvisoli]MDI5963264.1 hypothetical protein [Streptantibioticus silvisoli]
MLAVATLALGPALATLPAAQAQAATGSLTVTTIGRNGAKVKADVQLYNTRSQAVKTVKSGVKTSLPTGTYIVTADIETPDSAPGVMGMTDTLAGRQITVASGTTLTFDARQGKQVKASLSGEAGSASDYQGQILAGVCAKDDTLEEALAINTPQGMYEIPNSSNALQFAWMATYLDQPAAGTGAEYYLSGQTTGMPASVSYAYSRAKLAHVSVMVRSGESVGGQTSFEFQPTPPGNLSCETDMWGPAYEEDAPGYAVDAYVSPGTWEARTDEFSGSDDVGGAFTGDHVYAGGRTYDETFQRAVFGPTEGLPYVEGRAVTYTPYNTIADAVGGTGESPSTYDTVTLSRDGRTLKTQKLTTGSEAYPTFSEHITATGWYVLKVVATRVRAANLSSTVSLDWHFYANPAHHQVEQGYITRLYPTGLDRHNAASPGTTTPVTVYLTRKDGYGEKYAAETAKSVAVYASFDSGKTWHAVSARRSGAHWLADVKEPSAAGAVALRTVVTDTKGVASTQTIYRAYTVS